MEFIRFLLVKANFSIYLGHCGVLKSNINKNYA